MVNASVITRQSARRHGAPAPVDNARAEIAPGAKAGPKYHLVSALGRGGMGMVYAAENTWTGRRVAIKLLRPEYACVPEVVARFWHEARVASNLRHPNIVEVLDAGVDERGLPFIVEELLDGDSYDVVLARAPGRRATPEDALRTLLPVMDALAACHDVGVVHRDVKPSNILLARGPDGALVPKLIDFGVSMSREPGDRRSSYTGMPVGTPHYMSPEQARCERDLDARTDVWAMGVTLFEALTGRCPVEGPHIDAVMAQVRYLEPPAVRSVCPDVPADVAAVVDRALRTERDERPATMRALIGELLACEASRETGLTLQSTIPKMPSPPPDPFAQRERPALELSPPQASRAPSSRWVWAAVVPGFLAGFVVAALALRGPSPPPPEPPRALVAPAPAPASTACLEAASAPTLVAPEAPRAPPVAPRPRPPMSPPAPLRQAATDPLRLFVNPYE
jgi:serine/threonine-protein kinase